MLIGIITANQVLVTLQFRGKLSTPLPCLSGEGKDFVHLAASQHSFLGLVRGPGGGRGKEVFRTDMSWTGGRASTPQCASEGRMWGWGRRHEIGSV